MIAAVAAMVVLLLPAPAAGQAPRSPDLLTEYTARCDAGDSQGCAALGVAYEFGYYGARKDPVRAAALHRRACESGVSSACVALGYAQIRGDGVARDGQRAVTLFARACDLGNASGCENLALRLASGDGVAKDLARAASVWQKTCDLGDGRLCLNAASALESGRPFARDVEGALALYERACAIDERPPMGLGGCIAAARLLRERRDPEWPRIVALYERACEKGFDTHEACVLLGDLYRDGHGVERQRERALALYNTACRHQLVGACRAARELSGRSTPGIVYENVSDDNYVATVIFSPRDGMDSLRLRFFAEDYGAFIRIDVVGGDIGALVQRLSWPSADGEGQLYEGNPVVVSRDLDFDGDRDLMVLAWAGATGNKGYAVWLFDGRQFVFSADLTGLSNLDADPQRHVLTTFSTGGHAGMICDAQTLEWIGRRAVVTREVTQDWVPEKQAYVKTIRERASGVLQLSIRETHGGGTSVIVERFSKGRLQSRETVTTDPPAPGCH